MALLLRICKYCGILRSDKAIVYVHGGGWNAGNPRFFAFAGQCVCKAYNSAIRATKRKEARCLPPGKYRALLFI